MPAVRRADDPRAECCKLCQNRKRGAEHPGWKGGRVVAPDGYAKVYAPDHPRANLGRYLLPGESVHHRNGVRDDNRPENLELWVTGQPKGQRVEDVLAWAREVIARYEGLHVSVPAAQATADGPGAPGSA